MPRKNIRTEAILAEFERIETCRQAATVLKALYFEGQTHIRKLPEMCGADQFSLERMLDTLIDLELVKVWKPELYSAGPTSFAVDLTDECREMMGSLIDANRHSKHFMSCAEVEAWTARVPNIETARILYGACRVILTEGATIPSEPAYIGYAAAGAI